MVNLLNKLDKLNKLKLDQKQIFLVILVSLFILYLDFTFALKAQLKGIRSIGPKIIKLKTDLNVLTKGLSTIQDLKLKEPPKQEGAIPAKKILSNVEIPSLLEDISSIGNNNNVKIIKMLSSKELKGKESKGKEAKPKAVKTKEAKIKKDKTPETSKLEPLLITLDLSSDYHHFGSFLNALENDKVFMVIEELKIKNASGDYFKQEANLVLKTYVKK